MKKDFHRSARCGVPERALASVVAAVILAEFCGCGRRAVVPTEASKASAPFAQDGASGRTLPAPVIFDAGRVSKDIVYDCVIGGAGEKTVKSVTRNCGCTGVGLREGQPHKLTAPFKVSVSMQGRPAGKGSQEIVVTFIDGSAFVGRFTYDYWPLPSSSADYVVFKATKATKSIVLSFPGESGVKIINASLPPNMRYSTSSRPDGGTERMSVEFEIDRSMADAPRDGSLTIATSSRRRSEFQIPYLILRN